MSVVGIDFGNMNSVVAVARNCSVDVIINEVSNRLSPSMVSFDYDDNRRYIGEASKTLEISKLTSTVSQLKRLIMLAAGDKLSSADISAFSVVDGLDFSTGTLADKTTAVQIVAMFFGYIKEFTQTELGHSTRVSDCVISVPAFWGDSHRRILLDAAAIAGLSPLTLINENTAASLAFSLPKLGTLPPNMTLLMVDIGHSMTQVQLSKLTSSGLVVLANTCDASLGGRDIDNALAEYVAECSERGKPKLFAGLRSSAKAMARLRAACEKAKKVLSASSISQLSVECLYNDADVSMLLNRDILIEIMETRVNFFARLKHVLNSIFVNLNTSSGPSSNTCTQTDVSGTNSDTTSNDQNFQNCPEHQKVLPDHIEIVGGTTRIPAVKELITSNFNGLQVSMGLNQDEAIACGCAYQCAMLSPVFKVRPFEIKEINFLTYFISWGPGKDERVVLLEKNATIPTSRAVSFSYKQLPLTLSLISNYDGSSEHCHGQYYLCDTENCPSTPQPSECCRSVNNDASEIATDPNSSSTKNPEEISCKKTETKLNYDDAVIKIKVRYGSSGIISIDPKASLWIHKTDHQVQENKEQPEAIANSNAFMRSDKIISLSIISNCSLSKEEIHRLANFEAQMAAADRILLEAQASRNALEAFMYQTRNDLSSTFIPFLSSPEESEILENSLKDAESWLYPEQEIDSVDKLPPHELKVASEERLLALKKLFDPLIERAHAYNLAMERLTQAIWKAESLGINLMATIDTIPGQESFPQPPNTFAVIELCQRLEHAVDQAEQARREETNKKSTPMDLPQSCTNIDTSDVSVPDVSLTADLD